MKPKEFDNHANESKGEVKILASFFLKIQELLVNNNDVFVPPKPKEFDIAVLILICLDAVNGMKPSENTESGWERLRVNGAIPCNNTTRSSTICSFYSSRDFTYFMFRFSKYQVFIVSFILS